jgi:hypothetical protein
MFPTNVTDKMEGDILCPVHHLRKSHDFRDSKKVSEQSRTAIPRIDPKFHGLYSFRIFIASQSEEQRAFLVLPYEALLSNGLSFILIYAVNIVPSI